MVKEYEMIKYFEGECRYYIHAESEEEAYEQVESMDVTNAQVISILNIDCESVEDLEDEE